MRSVDFVSVGHITHDVVQERYLLGGPCYYSALTAKTLGKKVGMVTNFGKDFHEESFLAGLELRYQVSEHTTTFKNVYAEQRKQMIRGLADPIHAEQIPAAWQLVPIVYICPVANEIEPELVKLFKNSLVGIGAQGWMRSWDKKGEVHQKRWQDFKLILPYSDVIVFSEEDISDFGEEIIEDYIPLTKIVILTRGERGSTLFYEGQKHDICAFPTSEVEPTGAGDVFGSAFLIEYEKTRDPIKSAQFASVVASFVVEKEGSAGIPLLEQVQERVTLYNRLIDLQAKAG